MTYSKNKKVKIVGAPLDHGQKKLGVDMGPSAIRHAGLLDALQANRIQYEDYGDLSIDSRECNKRPSDDNRKEICRISENLAQLTFEAMGSGCIPIILGGDHSVSIGSIAGAAQKAKRLGLLWIDCHPDANTPETSPSGNIHGMTVAISLGYGYPELVNCAGFSPKVTPESVCLLGTMDIDEGEKQFLHNHNIEMFTIFDIERMGIMSVLDSALEQLLSSCDTIHVSFDVDALDPLIAPGTGIISRGGLSYREISYVMETLGQKNIVGSMDIIEINPLLDIKNQTSELVIELLLSALGGSYGDYQRNYLNKYR